MSDDRTTEYVSHRCQQIARTAQRVLPTDVGTWKSGLGLPFSPAEGVVISPADLTWLISAANRAATKTPVQGDQS